MFEKTLSDVVKGIRASRRDTSLYISQCIAEIKSEINSSDMFVKANALQKLTFLQMMGYGMSWASFSSIELMSSPRFAHKRVAYLAASQGFNHDTEMILLTTNLLKKELRGGVYEAGLAINCVSNVVTEDLARDLLPELTCLATHPQPYLRKKSVLCLFKMFVKYPQGLRLTFEKVQTCLNDPNPSVVSCAVNVITELSDRKPRNYLHLAPSFFQLLTNSNNNWMLIKVVKLLGSLVPEEPRLARKLLDPLSEIVRNTKAKSLLYEAVHTITLCLPFCRRRDGSMPASVPEIVTLCAGTLQSFVRESDQNLKYLGLVGFASLMQSHPRVLTAPGYRPIILTCLSDQDVTIRSRALGLLPGMASRKNLIELVTQLLRHVELATGTYKLELVSQIAGICSGDRYALLDDFQWYLNVLLRLGRLNGLNEHASLLKSQIASIALRVLPVRSFAVRRCAVILLQREGIGYGETVPARRVMLEVLPSVAWIVGEYFHLDFHLTPLVEEDKARGVSLRDERTHPSLIEALTSTSSFQKLQDTTQDIYLQAALKLFATAAAEPRISDEELAVAWSTLKQHLPLYSKSIHVEVQERAFVAQALMASFDLSGVEGASNVLSDGVGGDEDESQDCLLGTDATRFGSKTAFSSLVSSGARKAAWTLSYSLKPCPMKPTGVKVQRKKAQSPIGPVTFDLGVADFIVLSVLLEDYAADPFCMDSVSFTQQVPLRSLQSNSILDTGPFKEMAHEMAACIDGMAGTGAVASLQMVASSSSCVEGRRGARLNQADPFYLDPSPKTRVRDEGDPGRFGMIELCDSDEAVGLNSKKQKKKRKGKRKLSTKMDTVSVYDSGDEGADPEFDTSNNTPIKKPGKEFEGLAKVDLTKPLREDEIMPERRHHPLSDAGVSILLPNGRGKKKARKTKKGKRGNRKSDRSKIESSRAASASVGDLLELWELEVSAPQKSTPGLPQLLNDANDLLGLHTT